MVGINMVQNKINFESNPYFLKGLKIETLFIDIFEFLGYYIIPKRDYNKNGAPQCYNYDDRLSLPDIQIAKNGKSFYIEVKSKASREKYPDTGINTRIFEHYKKIQEITGINIFCIFYDEGYIKMEQNGKDVSQHQFINTKNTTYGNFISNLEIKSIGYPRKENKPPTPITYFKYPDNFIIICKDNNILKDYKNNKEILQNTFDKIF